MKLRVKFKKYGPIRFIGHLDVMRYFQKAIRRAGLDVAYTGGYSPHQIMTFASPLGVGMESNGEYMDIEVHSLISCENAMERLNRAGADGIEITSVKVLPDNAGNAMASVAAAAYTVRFRQGREPAFHITQALPDFLAREQIPWQKETKKGVREGIYELSWDGSAFHMLLDASSAGNIKPAQVIGAFLESCGETLLENALLITREDLYTNTGTGEAPVLTSLGEIGSDKLPAETESAASSTSDRLPEEADFLREDEKLTDMETVR